MLLEVNLLEFPFGIIENRKLFPTLEVLVDSASFPFVTGAGLFRLQVDMNVQESFGVFFDNSLAALQI